MNKQLLFLFTFFVFNILSVASAQQADLSQSSFYSSETFFSSFKHRNGALSPDGKFFSYIETADKGSKLVFIDTESMESATSIELSEKIYIMSYKWIDDDYIHITTRTTGKINSYLYKFKSYYKFDDSKDTKKLAIEGISKKLPDGYIVSILKNKTSQLLFSKKHTGSETQQLYRMTVNDLYNKDFSRAELIEKSPRNLYHYIYDHVSKKLIGLFLDENNNEITIKSRTFSEANWKLILKSNLDDFNLFPVGFIDDENLAVLTNKETDHVVLQTYHIPNQRLEKVLFEHPRYDLIDASLSKEGELIAVEYILNGLPHIHWLNADIGAFEQSIAARFEDDKVRTIAISSNGDKRILLLTGPNNPGAYYLYETQSNTAQKLRVKHPNFEIVNKPKHEILYSKTDDGEVIEGYLTTPSSFDNNTLLVMPHGGPIGVRDYNFYNPKVQYLANRGFSILRVNFRGSKGFGKDFREQGVAQFGKRIESDITTMVENHLQQNSYQNICSVGASYGGYSSMMLAHQHPETYDCIVASYGVYDLPLLFNYSNIRKGEEYSKYIARVVGENTQDLKQVSPLYYAKEINVPILLIAGKDDQIAGFEQSNRMRFVLQKHQKSIEYLFYEDVGHGHDNWYGARHEAAIIADFLNRQLGIHYPSPDSLTKSSKEALSYDAMIIADNYSNSRFIEPSERKAFTNLLKAVELDDGRATFNLASHYHRGDLVAKDISKAIELYVNAANLGYKNAYRRLAYIYMTSYLKQKNDDKALEYLQLALENASSDKLKNSEALFYCIAGDEYKNFAKCESSFLDRLNSTQKRSKRNNILTHLVEAIINSSLSSTEKNRLAQMFIDASGLQYPTFDFDFNSEGIWLYEESPIFGKRGKYTLVKNQDLAALSKKMGQDRVVLGVKFTPDHTGFAQYNKYTVALNLWKVFDKDGKQVSERVQWHYKSARNPWLIHYAVNEYKAGHRYELSIMDIYGNKKYTTNFQ